jgi:hypothetical protein
MHHASATTASTHSLTLGASSSARATLSTAIESLFPAIAFAVRTGIEYDPIGLICQLCDVNPSDPAAWALHSMLQVTYTALEHIGERNVAQEQLRLCRTELQNCRGHPGKLTYFAIIIF